MPRSASTAPIFPTTSFLTTREPSYEVNLSFCPRHCAGRFCAGRASLATPVPLCRWPTPLPVQRLKWDSKKFMHVSELRPGMSGYALTVFKGTKISRFGIEILGVVSKFNEGKDYIAVPRAGRAAGDTQNGDRARHERQPDLHRRAAGRGDLAGQSVRQRPHRVCDARLSICSMPGVPTCPRSRPASAPRRPRP